MTTPIGRPHPVRNASEAHWSLQLGWGLVGLGSAVTVLSELVGFVFLPLTMLTLVWIGVAVLLTGVLRERRDAQVESRRRLERLEVLLERLHSQD